MYLIFLSFSMQRIGEPNAEALATPMQVQGQGH